MGEIGQSANLTNTLLQLVFVKFIYCSDDICSIDHSSGGIMFSSGGRQARKSYHTWRSRSIFQKCLEMLQVTLGTYASTPNRHYGCVGEG